VDGELALAGGLVLDHEDVDGRDSMFVEAVERCYRLLHARRDAGVP
jgi:hypothetical protein